MIDAKRLISQGDQLFRNRDTLTLLWQEFAENFYPERADFTIKRTMGDDFAGNLTSSYPLLVRRELGDAISSMLRPRGQEWFSISIERDDRLDNSGRQALELMTKIQRRAMYDRATQFVRATKEGDHDFATFGQTVISVEADWKAAALLYRSWHLRDVVWCEQYNGAIGDIHRNWCPDLRTLMTIFGRDKLHRNVVTGYEKSPYARIECRHVVVPIDQYEGDQKHRTPYVSIYIDLENQHVISEVPSWSQIYCIPRWQTVSGSQYAYSPAAVAGLPDARLLQAMTLTLLEAGEMAVRPPLIATKEAIRGDVALYAGGITWADAQYDVSAKLKPGDRIEVRAEDGSYFAELIVQDAGRLYAKVAKLMHVDLESVEVREESMKSGEYEVKWQGPQLKWCVLRGKDRLKDGMTKGEAASWMAEHMKAA